MNAHGIPRRISPGWKVAQAMSVATAVGVVVLLLVRPELGLFLTWSVLIPAVPALLLIAPMVWRDLCPIAVVNQLPRRMGRGGRRWLSGRAQWWALVVAGVGLAVIIPLRLALFNHSGPALAGFVVSVLALALAGGLLFAGKSGWCASWCPVGMVERLYGQAPFLRVTHAHCTVCVGCTERCLDRDGPPAVARLLGEDSPVAPGDAYSRPGDPSSRPGDATGRRWLWQTPMGVFSAAFPGFVFGYFTAPGEAGLAAIYGWVLLLAAGSFVLVIAFQALFRLPVTVASRLGAVAAAAFYYWFTVPAAFRAARALWGVQPPAWLPEVLRICLLLLVLVWFLDAPRRENAA